MMKRFLLVTAVTLTAVGMALGQNSNSNSNNRTRTVAPKPSPTPRTATKSADSETSSPTQSKPAPEKTTPAGPSAAVLAAFDKVIEGIRRANVNMVTGAYWNSSTLVLFNYNGSVTKGWDQMRRNRETSYPDIKDVKLDVRDKHVLMLGRDGAVVTCLWTQSQTFKGQPDTASGRMTLVFKRFGNEWKAVHLHTSPDKPDPSRIPASEQPSPQ
jgi:ketosteroid isomerase-like protein